MHCQITAGLLEGWMQWKRLEKRKRKGRQQQRWLRYRLSATVNRHRRSLSPRVVFRLRSQSPGKVILPPFFFLLLLSFFRSRVLSFTYALLRCSRLYSREVCACFPIGPPGRLTASSPVQRISFLFCHLSWKLYGKWRYSFRGGKLGSFEEVEGWRQREDAKSAYNESKGDIATEDDGERRQPLCTTHIYICTYVYVHSRRIFPKGPFRVN